MPANYVRRRVKDLFKVKSGDFHALKELDSGTIPLVSCGDGNNGVIGYFDVPEAQTYKRSLTVAYNGSWPLLTKFHPYRFATKDDVAVLIPRSQMRETSLLFVAAQLSRETWRYSYGRKCFRKKLEDVELAIPVSNDGQLNEPEIARLLPGTPDIAIRRLFDGIVGQALAVE
jgi:type I restriction enzyme M protein